MSSPPYSSAFQAIVALSVLVVVTNALSGSCQRSNDGAQQSREETERDVTSLYFSVSHNLVDVVELALIGGEDVNVSFRGETPLHSAARNGSLGVTRTLVRYGARPNARNVEGFTPLALAAREGHAAIVVALLAAGADSSIRVGDERKSALAIAIDEGHWHIIVPIIEHAPHPVTDINKAGPEGLTPLHLAALSNVAMVVDALVRAGADVEAQDIFGCTPLHIAAERGWSDLVVALLRNGADVDKQDWHSRTPLCLAAQCGGQRVTENLLDAGADIHLRGKLRGYLPGFILENLLTSCNEKIADYSPLEVAVWWGHLAIIKSLIRHGADVNYVAFNGVTPLHVAAWSEIPTSIELLLEAGADTEARVDGKTPLHFTCESIFVAGTRTLLSRGADVDAICTGLAKGSSSLHFVARLASYLGAAEIVTLLLRYGANEALVDESGYTAEKIVKIGLSRRATGHDANAARVVEILKRAPGCRSNGCRKMLLLFRHCNDQLRPSGDVNNNGAGVVAWLLGVATENVFLAIVQFL